jgi:hypothetical protein
MFCEYINLHQLYCLMGCTSPYLPLAAVSTTRFAKAAWRVIHMLGANKTSWLHYAKHTPCLTAAALLQMLL